MKNSKHKKDGEMSLSFKNGNSTDEKRHNYFVSIAPEPTFRTELLTD